ncbi:MAG: lipocalin family protein [Gemmatimonadota bacterium]|nr:MAG: lipocalin family protein [Gemmatimonadota bacterium]
MKSIGLLLTCSIVVTAACTNVAAQSREELGPPRTVERVDLERYVGLWYEIARIPNGFQEQCVSGVTAEYELRDDGRIDVINRCITSSGRVDEAKGLARIEDRESNARLKVSFFSIVGWRPIWGDYWIIGLGDDYEFALVGSPDRKYGWILSREPELDWYVLERIYTILGDQGYHPGDFEMTDQASSASG